MFTKKYKIAEHVVEISSLYEKVHRLCSDYETDKPAEFTVNITAEDLAFEKQKSDSEHEYEGLPLPKFSEETLEATAVYRKIAEKFVDFDTFVFHGSVVAVEGQAYLFTAKSGTGKSTHTSLWREYFGEKAVMVNDDKPMLKVTDSGVIAYGTPYNGKHRLGQNIAVPLKAICILTRSEDNHIEPVSVSQAYPMLLQQVYRPSDPVQMAKTLKLIDKLSKHVSLFRMGCNMDISAAEVAYNAMKG